MIIKQHIRLIKKIVNNPPAWFRMTNSTQTTFVLPSCQNFFRNKAELKRVITRSWREIDQDKEMIRNLISSIPKRLQAVIDVDGRQITKEDY